MNEIEVKILDINKSEVIKRIKELGGKLLFENKEFNAVFFESPKHQVIRIRQEGDTVVICHKNKLHSETDAKIMEETEIITDDFNQAIKLLQNLGHKLAEGGIRKIRTSYKLNNCKIEFDNHLDKYVFIPEYLEIEGTSEDEIFETAKLIGFSKEDCNNWNTSKVIEHYKK
jgi:adenylate cyclase class 2